VQCIGLCQTSFSAPFWHLLYYIVDPQISSLFGYERVRDLQTGKVLSRTQNWCGVVRVANIMLCVWSSKQLSKMQRASNSYLKTPKMEIFHWEMSPWHVMRTAEWDCHHPPFLLEARFLCEPISHRAEVVSALAEPVAMTAFDYRSGVVSNF